MSETKLYKLPVDPLMKGLTINFQEFPDLRLTYVGSKIDSCQKETCTPGIIVSITFLIGENTLTITDKDTDIGMTSSILTDGKFYIFQGQDKSTDEKGVTYLTFSVTL